MGTLDRSPDHPTLDDPSVVPSIDPWGLVGEIIDQRYRVDGLIGLGGMGSVLRCHHLGLGRDVAVKVLHPDRNVHAESSARFTREARSASRLDHPNCVRVLDFGEWQPRPDVPAAKYLAMELVDGQELGRLLREPLLPRTAADYTGQILDGLDHAHARGIVHRDLKPENVIVTKLASGTELLKLVDFGIAKILGGEGLDARMTRTGRVFGTPHYMSPEQVAGGEVDGRADLYAVGVLFHQMLTGKLPFDADDPTVLMGKQLFAEPPPLPRGLPASLLHVASKLLAKEPEDRYQTAAEARADLDVAIRDLTQPVATRPRRSGIRVALTSTMAVVATALVAVSMPVEELHVAHAQLPSPADAHAWPSGDPRTPVRALAAVQELRRGADLDGALARIDALLDAAPDDAQLYLERARILALAGEGARALVDYERAVSRDPGLVRKRVVAEIAALARQPALRSLSLDLVLHGLGEAGHPIAAELLAADDAPLGYRDRHRALAAIAEAPAAASIDAHRMIALDLAQAKDAESPCLAFAAALAAIERDPAPVYAQPLRHAVPPSEAAADAAESVLCPALPARLAEVRAQVVQHAKVRPKRRPATRSDARIAKNDARARDERAPKRRSPVGRLRGLAG
jgi:hypothetical protein